MSRGSGRGPAGGGGGGGSAASTSYDGTALAGIGVAGVEDVQDLDGAFTTLATFVGSVSAAANAAASDADQALLDAAAANTNADTRAAKASNLSDLANGATAFGNIKQAATESATGVVELATTAEAVTGTDTTRAVTAAGVAAALTPTPTYVTVGSGGGAPAFANDWVAGSTALRYTKVNGIVWVTGIADASAATAGPIFTLPAGFRPGSDRHFGTYGGGGGGPQIAVVAVNFDTGVVELLDPAPAVLDGAGSPNVGVECHFLAEN